MAIVNLNVYKSFVQLYEVLDNGSLIIGARETLECLITHYSNGNFKIIFLEKMRILFSLENIFSEKNVHLQ